ncbi:uncharacterized protein LOC119390558 isoform X1 [Rhipicephalus sanguineus]|uniref:uncharacterized protein LOC119390558 isoform X1 n=1 Tax=Rhipicephalus sanguineus TaxID=34632 RepID=UPI0020C30324|nr:uncharacterized protein LOC119390558 isoform X1 [Rhipicephalus sanguineus]
MKERHLQLILATCALVVYANAAPIGEIKGGSQSSGGPVVALPGVSPPGIGVLGGGISGGGNLGGVNPALSGGGSRLPAHSGSLGGPVIAGGMGGGSHGSLQIRPAQHPQASGSTFGQSHGSHASAGSAPGGLSLNIGPHGSGLRSSASAVTAHGGPSLDLGLQGSGLHSSASAAGAASGSSLNLGLAHPGHGPSGLPAPHGVGSGVAGPTTSLGAAISPSGGNIVGRGHTAPGALQPVQVHTHHETRVTITPVPLPGGPPGQPVPLLPGASGAITSGKGGSIGVDTSKGHLPPPLGQAPAVPPVVIVPGSKQSPSLPDVKVG